MKNFIVSKKTLMVALLLVSAMAVFANPVVMEQAKKIGAKYLSASVNMKTNAQELTLAKTYYTANGDEAFYVFNAANGFVIVSAQDVATPILGYSDEGTFDANDIPEAMEWWLQDYAGQIQYGMETRNINEKKTAKQWELVKATGMLSEKKDSRTVVGPLLRDKNTGEEILWNQSQIYSTECPIESTTGNHFAAGCVPVSMSQIMRKWECPSPTGYGAHTSYGSHHEYVNFGDTYYNWDKMPISLNEDILGRTPTSEEITAVGTLLHHAGVAIDAFYKLSGTDAHSEKARDALVTYFGYSDEAKLERLTFKDDSIAIWKVKLRSSLDHDYPLYYSGIHSGTLGHAFACDGYDDQDNFHINWGYDGLCNGYFPIGGLNYGSGASGEYNTCNDVIFNIHPAGNPTMFTINVSSNDDDMGTVSGNGSYAYGSQVTVTATAKPGYSFCYWSLDGVNMSENATYTFRTYYNRNMVAVFAGPYTITTDDDGNGTASGGGSYYYGDQCSLTATPSDGYIFVNWTKGGEIVSSHNPYSFKVVDDGDYVANFMVNDGVTISDGDTYDTQYYPFGKGYKYYITEQIFTADEINCRGTIEGIKFFATEAITRSLDIYVTSTEKSAFSSKSDWISVTNADLVYSGEVSFASSNWTLIQFTNPFEYDGVNNLVILIDDNTGANPSTTNFKAFDGAAQQSLMYRSDSNADPLSLTFEASYIGTWDSYTTKLNRKNQVVLSIIPDASTTYSVTATAAPAGAGEISGEGAYIFGELCTLTAQANDFYEFRNWTKGGVQVSTDATYSFNVKEAQDLVANFYSVQPIAFMDDNVAAICIENWDTDEDGFLSTKEAADVMNLGTVFNTNTSIMRFEELQYFTGLTSIANEAFKGCTNLTSIVIPENITSIGNSAFENCSNLTGELSLPSSLTSIGNSAFENCSNLTGELSLPSSLETIGTHAFDGCSGLTGSLVIPNSVTSLGMYAFYNCSGFDGTLTIGNSLTSINMSTFQGCIGFTGNLYISNSVTSIYGNAFNGCTGFNGLLIVGNSLSSISYSAFQNCSGITGIVTKRSTPPTANASSFTGMTNTITLYVPNGTESTYSAATGWNYFSSVKAQLCTSDVPNPTADDVLCVNYTGFQNSDVTARYIYFTDDSYVLTVDSGRTLTSIEGVETHDASQLVLNDGAQLICNTPVAATMQKSITGYGSNDYGWYFIASPVTENLAPSAVANMTNDEYRLYYYNEPDHYWKYANDLDNFSLTNGKGYLYARQADETLSFSGTVNASNSDITVENLTCSSAAGDLAGFNLVGNPFPCNATVNCDAFYKMDENGEFLEAATSGEAIAPCTGVMVQLESAGGVTFTKSTEPASISRGIVNLKVNRTGGLFVDNAIVRFDGGSLLNKLVIKEDATRIYLPKGNQEYAIVNAEGEGELPVNFKASENGVYIIAADVDTEVVSYLHLIDNITGADVDLLASPVYTFTAKTTDYAYRFRLVFNANDEDGASTGSAAFAYYCDGEIIITDANADATLQIVDLTGRVVVSTDVARNVSTSGIRAGVYVLRLLGENGVKTQKITITP